ncbi:hypothetical protein HOLleu_20118 [Holothuria leucospilota]|uniref:Uncharacterized protein n=1 Tax=Holothuria leucospilota TaxID=206669 RepID=A0A9Q1H5G9_HOLLE|nr:hypothetical protein HOLleu_20118 [Holothuria leucospilota]
MSVAITNSVVVTNVVVTEQEKPPVNHFLHCIISIFFWPWLIVWICLCISNK